MSYSWKLYRPRMSVTSSGLSKQLCVSASKLPSARVAQVFLGFAALMKNGGVSFDILGREVPPLSFLISGD